MTCIVGIAEGGKVYIGGDSAGTAGMDLHKRKDKKVFRNGDFIMGFTSSFRMGQLLEHALTVPKRHADEDVFSFMVNQFVNAVRDCLKSGGYATSNNSAESGGTFLVGYEGRLFCIHSDYQVAESLHGFDACGCGDSFALGSLYSTSGETPIYRLKMALEAAEEFSAGVRSPFNYVSIGGEE